MKTTIGPEGALPPLDDVGEAVEHMLREEARTPMRDYSGASNLIESEKSCWLQIALPGVAPSSLHIEASGRKVTVAGTYHVPEVQGASYLRRQLPQGGFEAIFGVPADVDSTRAEAQYDHGILTIWLPKLQARSPRAIKVNCVG